MKVVVVGGTGFVGSHVSMRLGRDGFDVVIVARGVTSGPLPARCHPRVTLVHASAADRRRLVDAMSGADAVVHLAGPETCDATVAAASQASVDRIVSLLPNRGSHGSMAPWDLRAEPVHGQGGALLPALSALSRRLVVTTPGTDAVPVEPVAVDDVVTAIVAAVDGGLAPGRWLVAGPDVFRPTDLVRMAAAAAGRRAWFFRLPVAFHATTLERLVGPPGNGPRPGHLPRHLRPKLRFAADVTAGAERYRLAGATTGLSRR